MTLEPNDVDSVSELRQRHAAELDRLADRQRRQIDGLKAGSRYQIGDAIITATRSPRHLPRSIRQLWSLFRNRSRRRIAIAPLEQIEQPRSNVRIGAVLDEFSWSCFANEAQLVELSPDTAPDAVLDLDLDLVFVESAWRGNRGQWSYLVNGADSTDRLRALVEACGKHGVPAVFWNKEDPVGFDPFIAAATLFPTVLTTDADIVGRYREHLPASVTVGSLPFAAQPRTHNPIGRPLDPLRRVCFAGAWRGDKYPERALQIEELMGPAHEMGCLDIFDRYANDSKHYRRGFPDPYSSDVLGSLSYEETIDAYRRYAAFLNVNSVTDSPTMFSRRVFEILACGTPVISTPSRGIEELLGDVVISAGSRSASRRAVEEMISDRGARERRGHLGYRLVHGTHTYQERLRTILASVDFDPGPIERPEVAWVCVTNRPDRLDSIVEAFESQTYEHRRLVIACNSDDYDVAAVRRRVAHRRDAVVLALPEEQTLGDCLNEAVASVDSAFVAKIDDDDHYGPDYLADMMLTFSYSGARLVGKRSYFAYVDGLDRSVLRFPHNEFRYVDEVAGGTLIFDRGLAIEHPFRQRQQGTDTAFLNDVRGSGLRIFSSDRFNFVQHRSADVGAHTWQIEHGEFLTCAELIGTGFRSEEFFL